MMRTIKQTTATVTNGGGLLLGVQHPVIVAHGCSQPDAIANAILSAHRVVNTRQFAQFNRNVSAALQPVEKVGGAVRATQTGSMVPQHKQVAKEDAPVA